MEIKEVEEKLREKFNDEYTIKMFTNFVLEFQECFGNMMSTEEVINRIKLNIYGDIKIVEKLSNERLDGKYGDDGIVYLRKDVANNEKYVKYLLFHEILHAITTVRNEDGIEIMDGFSYLKDGYGMGLNEGMTEYLTQIRNERFEIDREELISGYRTVVELIRKMINLLGFEKIMYYYLYEPDKFKEYINSQGMNYDEIEFAFRCLCGKDQEIYNIGNGKTLEDNNDYRVHRYAKTIFDNYSNAIGEVNSLEEFENKYKFFHTYSKYNCINVMLLEYYKAMGKDIDKLLRDGVKFNNIREVLNKLNINLDALKTVYNISKLFVEDKNQTAINLYNLYTKDPSLYLDTFAHNYTYIFDYFKEMDASPNEELYDAFKYPSIGALLKEQPHIDYSDISYYKIEESKSKINLYLFYTSDLNYYGYTFDGRKIEATKGEDNSDVFEVKMNEYCSCKFICLKNGSFRYSITAPKGFDLKEYMKDVNFDSSHFYSERSDIEYWLKESGEEEQNLQITLKKIEERIKSRSGKNYDD